MLITKKIYILHKKDKGFTLVEIVVVLAVISILTAIIIPSALKYVDNSKAEDCEVNRKSLVSLLNSARDLSPDITMEEIITNNPEIFCPSTAEPYQAINKDTVRCPFHDEENSAHPEDFEMAENITPTIFTESEVSTFPDNSTPTFPDHDSVFPSENNANKFYKDYFELEDINGNRIKFSCISMQHFSEEYIETNRGSLELDGANGIDIAFPYNKVYLDEETNLVYIQCYQGTIRVSFHHSNNGIEYKISPQNSPQIDLNLRIINYEDNLISNNSDSHFTPISSGQVVKGPDGNYYVTIQSINNYSDYNAIIKAQSNSDHYAWRKLELYQG